MNRRSFLKSIAASFVSICGISAAGILIGVQTRKVTAPLKNSQLIDGNSIVIRDENNIVRVRIGKL